MIKVNKRYYIIISILVLFLVVNIINMLLRENNIDISEEDRVLDVGQIGYGVYNDEGNIIDNGSTILDLSSSINHIVGIEQNLPAEREYLLLVLLDFKQVSFYVDDKVHDKYKICLKGKDSYKIDLSLNVPENSKELAYIIIKMPDYKIKPGELAKAHSLQEVLSLRFRLSEKEEIINYETKYQKSAEKPLDNIFISKKEDVLKMEYIIESGSLQKLTLGNYRPQKIDYGLIAFLDWEQVNIDNSEVKFYSVEEGGRVFFDVEMPQVTESSNYQILAFPYPYKVERTNFESSYVFGSHRLHIKP